ncbi:MAG: hypothetical protein HKM95_11065 [Inquilinus sp.]|nr:hypothetical protein [Inquilinus sp.]
MRRPNIRAVLPLILVVLLAGCASIAAMYSAPKYRSVAAGQTPAPGEVLVIGRFVLDPPVQQGVLAYLDPLDSKQNITFAVTEDLSEPVDMDALIPMVPEAFLMAEYNASSFLPMPPGSRYLRMGSYPITAYCSVQAIGPTGGCRAMHSEQVTLVENVRIGVPAGATAVYIGTIVFEHDGERGTRTYVRDDFRTALAELDALGIPGIDSRSVTKELAEIVGPTVARR